MTVAMIPADRVSSDSSAMRRGWALLGAIVYGAALALMPGDGILDRENYMGYLANAQILLIEWVDGGVIRILANEPLWIVMNWGLSFLLSQEQSLQLLIFIPAAAVAYFSLRVDARFFVVLVGFLLLPQVIKNHVVHLRQGVAVAVFILGWFAHTRRLRWGMWCLTPFIHSSFFFVLGIFCLASLCRRWRLPVPLVVAMMFAFGAAVGLALQQLALVAGARQGEESVIQGSLEVSGLGFVFWLSAMVLLIMQGKSFVRAHLFEISTVVFYLATYFLTPYSGRIFESTLLLVLLAGLRMRGLGRPVFLLAMLTFGALHWAVVYLRGFSAFVET